MERVVSVGKTIRVNIVAVARSQPLSVANRVENSTTPPAPVGDRRVGPPRPTHSPRGEQRRRGAVGGGTGCRRSWGRTLAGGTRFNLSRFASLIRRRALATVTHLTRSVVKSVELGLTRGAHGRRAARVPFRRLVIRFVSRLTPPFAVSNKNTRMTDHTSR